MIHSAKPIIISVYDTSVSGFQIADIGRPLLGSGISFGAAAPVPRPSPREEAASPVIWRSGEFDLDCDRFAVVPFMSDCNLPSRQVELFHQ